MTDMRNRIATIVADEQNGGDPFDIADAIIVALPGMKTDEKLAVLARAIIQISETAATTWYHDGDAVSATGIDLNEEGALKEIAKGAKP